MNYSLTDLASAQTYANDMHLAALAKRAAFANFDKMFSGKMTIGYAKQLVLSGEYPELVFNHIKYEKQEAIEKNRVRILITSQHRKQVGNEIILGHSVRVEQNGEHLKGGDFFRCIREWDSTATNQLNRLGAMRNIKDIDGINKKINELLEKYPDAKIHDNS